MDAWNVILTGENLIHIFSVFQKLSALAYYHRIGSNLQLTDSRSICLCIVMSASPNKFSVLLRLRPSPTCCLATKVSKSNYCTEPSGANVSIIFSIAISFTFLVWCSHLFKFINIFSHLNNRRTGIGTIAFFYFAGSSTYLRLYSLSHLVKYLMFKTISNIVQSCAEVIKDCFPRKHCEQDMNIISSER